jgi:hypothetical protein
MARVKSNPLIEGLSGKVGKLVFKNYGYGTVITVLADRSKVKLSAKQKKANKNFKEAVAFAKAVIADPKKAAKYQKTLQPGKTVYHTALADFLSGKINASLK